MGATEKQWKYYRHAEGILNDLQIIYRMDDEKYELLARLAYGRPSIQWVLTQEVFRNGWKSRLAAYRKKQRAAGISDDEFLHAKRRRAKGLPIHPGRRARRAKEIVVNV